MSGYCEERYTIYDERFPRARVRHKCKACGETIPPGQHYARVGVLFDGNWSTIIRCARCQKIHEHLRGLGGSDLWPDERLNCGQEYEEHWGEKPPDEIAALAFALPGEVPALGEHK